MIFTTKGLMPLALYFALMGLLIGAGIGVLASALAYRSRFSIGMAARAAALGGVTFVFAVILAGWADSYSPASWLRMGIARHGLAVALVSSTLASLLAGVKRSAAKDGQPT